MALIKWESPHRELDWSGSKMRRLFEDFDRNFFTPQWSNRGSFVPTVDINEDKDNLYFIAELPGLSENDVKVSISEGVLTIRGEKKREEEHHDRNFYRMERNYGEFVRQFSLPEDVKEEDIQANFKDGLLEIQVPKQEPSKPKEREIQIKGGKEFFPGNGNTGNGGNGNTGYGTGDGKAKATNGQKQMATA